MGVGMSKSMFANPKAALGFAGVTIVIAIVASFSADSFVPSDDAQPETVVEPELTAETRTAQPATQATTWADGGGAENYADDWSDAATDSVSNRGWSEQNSADEINEPAFGNYAPETSRPTRQARPSPSSSSASVRSGASPSAPPLAPPSGGNPDPEISIED